MARPKKNGLPPNELNEHQRLAVLQWLAEGCTNAEVNARAKDYIYVDEAGAEQPMPFSITPQNLYAYRNRYDERLKELRKERENIALNTGLAVPSNRVVALQKLAGLLETDLYEKQKIWLQDAKTVAKEAYDFYKFNEAEISQLRGIYDDIARETGGRVHRADITTKDKPLKGYAPAVNPDNWDVQVANKQKEAKHDNP